MGTGGTHTPPSSGLVSPVPAKSKMRLMSKFSAKEFNYKIVRGSYTFVPSTYENVPTRLLALSPMTKVSVSVHVYLSTVRLLAGLFSSRNAPQRRSGPFRHILKVLAKATSSCSIFVCLQCLHSFLVNYFASGFT